MPVTVLFHSSFDNLVNDLVLNAFYFLVRGQTQSSYPNSPSLRMLLRWDLYQGIASCV